MRLPSALPHVLSRVTLHAKTCADRCATLGMVRLCSFCSREEATVHASRASACDGCALIIAELANDPSADIWAKTTQTSPPSDADRDFEGFKAEVEAQIAVEDADSRLALAVAYIQMGLLDDARREAGMALRARRNAGSAAGALDALVSEPLLTEAAVRRLKARVSRRLE